MSQPPDDPAETPGNSAADPNDRHGEDARTGAISGHNMDLFRGEVKSFRMRTKEAKTARKMLRFDRHGARPVV